MTALSSALSLHTDIISLPAAASFRPGPLLGLLDADECCTTELSVNEAVLNGSKLPPRSVHPFSLQFSCSFDSEAIRIKWGFTNVLYSRLSEGSPATSLLSSMLFSHTWLCIQQGNKSIAFTAENYINYLYMVASLILTSFYR